MKGEGSFPTRSASAQHCEHSCRNPPDTLLLLLFCKVTASPRSADTEPLLPGEYRLRFPKADKHKQTARSWPRKGHLFTAGAEARRRVALLTLGWGRAGQVARVCCSACAHKCPPRGLQKQFEVGRQHCKYKIHKYWDPTVLVNKIQ